MTFCSWLIKNNCVQLTSINLNEKKGCSRTKYTFATSDHQAPEKDAGSEIPENAPSLCYLHK